MKMTESPNLVLEDMESADYLDGESEKEGAEKISVSQQTSNKSDDNYVVDMERFSHFIHEKDMSSNSRITLQNFFPRKGSARGEKKFNPTTANERDASRLTTSPKECTPEKPIVVGVGSTDNSIVHHHQITITNGSISTTNNNTDSKFGRKRLLSFRRSHSTFIDPRRILIFFATLSSMGTILLIYFTLSMNKLKDDDDGSTALS